MRITYYLSHRKKIRLIVFLLFISVSVLLIVLSVINLTVKKNKTNVLETSAIPEDSPVFIIDAGHGGFDGGAVASDGTNEKELNLSVALKLGNILSLSGCNVIYTRTEDKSTDSDGETLREKKISDINNRMKLTEKYENGKLLSIHMNKFTSSAVHGAQVFYSAQFEESKRMATDIQQSIALSIQTDNKRSVKPAEKNIFILYYAKIPSVIVECGFLSNPSELENLKSEEYQEKLAFAIASAVCDVWD